MKKGFSQEGLKLIACLSMLIDHIGYKIIYPIYSHTELIYRPGTLYDFYLLCRCIGRLAFPIFAFLLVEGVRHSRNRKKYALRLMIGTLLSEIPYNLVVSGRILWQQQSVMVTLLLGFCALLCMEKCPGPGWKAVAAAPFAILAELTMSDYGWAGVALVVLFALSTEFYRPNLMRFGGMVVLFHYMSSYVFQIGGFSLPMQVLGVLSLLFIANYDGRKTTDSKAVQWAFYLFYPAHLLILWGISTLLTGVWTWGISVHI